MAAEGTNAGISVDIIADIYEAAFDRQAFARLAGLLAKAVGSPNGVVVIRDGSGPVDLSATSPPEALRAYLEHYGRIDPFTETMFKVPPGTVIRSEEHISEVELDRHEFYVDYMRGLEMYRPAGVLLPISQGKLVAVGIDRPRRAPLLSHEDAAKLQELARHIQRAMQLRFRLDATQLQAQAGFAVLEHLDFGVVVSSGEGRIMFVNRAAEALACRGCGLLLADGRISAALPREAARLAQLLRDAAAAGPGGALRITSGERGDDVLALVLPLPRRLSESGPSNLTLVACRGAHESGTVPDRMLAQLFGLSAAEASVVSALASGSSLDVLAAQRGVKIATLRSQLEAIFRKTGTGGQRELMRLIGSLPQVR